MYSKYELVRCPRCRGNMIVDYDKDGEYLYCLQCGFHCEQSDIETFLSSSKGSEKGYVATHIN